MKSQRLNSHGDTETQSKTGFLRAAVSLWLILLCVLTHLGVLAGGADAAQPPTPQPFPQPGARQTQTARPAPSQPPPQRPSPSAPAPAVATGPEAAPGDGVLGLPVYPGAQFIASYDAGRGQRYYIYGTEASFADVVAYYRAGLKQRGELVYDVPATHEFDVGRFREETMAFPPGVTVKDYQSDVSQGYPNPKPGGQPARFPTLIQIVPLPLADR